MIYQLTKYVQSYLDKRLSFGYISRAGRNFSGHICVRHKGGGIKRKFQYIDFYRRVNSFCWVVSIYKTAFRTALLGSVVYTNGLSNYIILAHNVMVDSYIYTGSFPVKDLLPHDGLTLPLAYMNLFSTVHCIELKPYAGIKLIRAAGTCAVVNTKTEERVSLKLNNGSILTASKYCTCSLGTVSNPQHKNEKLIKAGVNRSLGKRPTVRGVAMNPHDHPHGGGEGKKSPPVGARSPWGWLTKGHPTVLHKRAKKLLR